MPQVKLLEKLERMNGGRDSLAGWRHVLGADFDEVRPLLASVTGERASTYPCPVFGTSLMVRERLGGNGYVAFASGDDAGADDEDLMLTWEDVQAWSVDGKKLEEALQGCRPHEPGPNVGVGGDGRTLDDEFSWLPVAKVENDYRKIVLPDGGVLDLSRKHKRRLFLKYAWEQCRKAGVREFYYEEIREGYMKTGTKSGVKSDRFRDDLFKGQAAEFNELFNTVGAPESQEYRWRVRLE
jgi:hypothetical protein